jgi:hypothetical protein
MAEKANTRVSWRGVTLDARTRDALKWVERKAGVTITPSQGSYRPRTSYSGSTHMGSSAVDLSIRAYSTAQRKLVVKWMKRAGFAVWYRKPCSSWSAHVHGILIGGGKDGTATVGGCQLSSGAASQVRSFDAGRDGLSGNRVDDTYRPSPKVRFSWKQGKPVER